MTESLADCGLPPGVAEMVLDQLSCAPGKMHLLLNNVGGSGAVAIPEKDFPLLKSCATIVGNAVGAGTLIGWAPAAVASLVILMFEFRRRSVRLTVLQGRILRELKAHPGLTKHQILQGLDLAEAEMAAIQEELKQLKEMRTEDRTTVALVSKDTQDRWYVEGV